MLKYMNHIILLLVIILGTGNAFSHSLTNQLNIHGDLRKISSNNLNEVKSFNFSIRDETLYGIGMPQGLDQEVLVLRGLAYTAGFDNFQYKTAETKDLDMAFFVFANIPVWQEIIVPDDIRDFNELETFIAQKSREAGFDLENGFPFRLVAKIKTLHWFVVGGMGNLEPTPLKSFLRQRILSGLEDRTIEAFGTYAEGLVDIASAPSTPMHMHFVTTDQKPLFIGHIDNALLLDGPVKLYLPIQP